MFLSTIDGRYWVELFDQTTADWEGLRMNHAVAGYFGRALRDRLAKPPGELAEARFFSLRDRKAEPVSTAMMLHGRISIGVGRSNRTPFPQFIEDYRILARRLAVSFSTSCYPYGR